MRVDVDDVRLDDLLVVQRLKQIEDGAGGMTVDAVHTLQRVSGLHAALRVKTGLRHWIWREAPDCRDVVDWRERVSAYRPAIMAT